MFDPGIYEANESSSTCGRRSICPVETGTPPYGTANIVTGRASVKGLFLSRGEIRQNFNPAEWVKDEILTNSATACNLPSCPSEANM